MRSGIQYSDVLPMVCGTLCDVHQEGLGFDYSKLLDTTCLGVHFLDLLNVWNLRILFNVAFFQPSLLILIVLDS